MILGPWEASWPADRLGELLIEVVGRSTLGRGKVENPPASFDPTDAAQVELWIQAACDWLGVEAEPTQAAYPEVESFLRHGGPAILRMRVDREFRFLGLLGARGRKAKLLTPEGSVASLPITTLRDWLCARLEDPLDAEVRAFLRRAGVAEKEEERARSAVLRQRLGAARIGGLWMIRPGAGSSFARSLSRAGIPGRMALLTCGHGVQYALFLAAWWLIGRAALEGRVEPGWMAAWMLILLTLVPLRAAVTWLQGVVSTRAGGVLKQRLLAGALRLEPEEIRHRGTGELLGNVLESEALESLALGGGFLLLLGGVEIVMSGFVLAQGAGGLPHVGLLAAWIALTGGLGWVFFQRRVLWTRSRLDMTHQLVENLLGYRTRLAQEGRERWHEGEDRELEVYLRASSGLDRLTALLSAIVPRGWMAIGIAGLAPVIATGEPSMPRIALAVGGVILAYRALRSIAGGMAQTFGAVVAWQSVREMFHAAARPQHKSAPSVILDRGHAGGKLIEAREVTYVYPGRQAPALAHCDFEVKEGDRIMVQGPSGGGKSTLAAILAGLRRPGSGLLLLNGLDQQSTGTRVWRRAVVLAPQFHENHILTESLAFNLLMGRRWPAYPREIAEAIEVCKQLGLGELLDRMPAGIFQMVGETGWQLSHGERNRVFLARTLLQNQGLTILDESFEPLDSENALKASRLV
ncbi:MAG TPA: ABC transporter ATP-binding protein, partial [Thermoanaerobaculia bacterium]|nr:ABC transporter ATP-binding protein [Thermoanaerobaculia bacterium]